MLVKRLKTNIFCFEDCHCCDFSGFYEAPGYLRDCVAWQCCEDPTENVLDSSIPGEYMGKTNG